MSDLGFPYTPGLPVYEPFGDRLLLREHDDLRRGSCHPRMYVLRMSQGSDLAQGADYALSISITCFRRYGLREALLELFLFQQHTIVSTW